VSKREERLDLARTALRTNRDVSKLYVCPGPRGADTVRFGIRRLGRHLNWYIGEFQHSSGISGPVKCEEAPTFRTGHMAKAFLASVQDLDFSIRSK